MHLQEKHMDTTLKTLIRKKRWQYGKALIESHKHNIEEFIAPWLVGHVKRMADAEPQYLAEHAPIPAIRSRLLSLGISDQWLGFEPLTGGIINFAIHKHILRGHGHGHGDTVEVMEKVLHSSKRDGFERESVLLETQGHAALKSPKIYGTIEKHPFLFLYTEYIQGRKPTSKEFRSRYRA